MELLRRYYNRPDLLGPMLEVLRRIREGDRSDLQNCIESRGAVRPSDRLSEADVSEIVIRFGAGTPQHKLAAEYGISISTLKRILRKSRLGSRN